MIAFGAPPTHLFEFGDLLLGEENEDRGWGLLCLAGRRAAGRAALRAGRRVRGGRCRRGVCSRGICWGVILGRRLLLLDLLLLLRLWEENGIDQNHRMRERRQPSSTTTSTLFILETSFQQSEGKLRKRLLGSNYF